MLRPSQCAAPQGRVTKVLLAQPMVDVVAAQAAHQLTEQMQLFDGGVSEASAPMALAPCSAMITDFRPLATYSSATLQSTSARHHPV